MFQKNILQPLKFILNPIYRTYRRSLYFFIKGSRVNGYFCRRTTIGRNVFVHVESHILRSVIGNNCIINKNTIISDSTILDYTILQQGTIINFSKMGKFTGIADYCRIGAEAHPVEWVTTHLMTYSPRFGIVKEVNKYIYNKRASNLVTIGHDVWIGHGAIIMPGIKIGNGAVIGAGSVVTKNVEAYSIVAGNPAKKLKMRFEPDIVECLDKIRWWEWEIDLIKSRISDFHDPKIFCIKYLNE